MMITKLKKIINFIQFPWFKISYKKNINPLKEVKHEQKPVNKIFLVNLSNFLLIIKPKKNDPTIEIIKLLSISNLKNVAV